MARVLRAVLLLVVACLVSLALLFLIIGRGVSQEMVPIYWAKMLLTGDYVAELVKGWYGANPPSWVMRLAVVWHRVDPPQWWWLPILVILVSFVVGRLARRKSRR